MTPRRRSDERGAALFLVTMVLTILSAIGIFAVRAASQVDLAAGFNRHAVQAGYVAEFATRADAADIAAGSDAELIMQRGIVTNVLGKCEFSTSPTCWRKQIGDIWGKVDSYFGSVGTSTDKDLIGTLSRSNNPTIRGTFSIETDDLGPALGPIAGNQDGKIQYFQVTSLGIGRVRPEGVFVEGDCTTTSALDIATGVQKIRSHMTYGPFPK
jgi:hypothetical protein